jgi:hypothetical protein
MINVNTARIKVHTLRTFILPHEAEIWVEKTQLPAMEARNEFGMDERFEGSAGVDCYNKQKEN